MRVRIIIIVVGMICVLLVGSLYVYIFRRKTIMVFHAGSLTVPFQIYATMFEEQYDVSVRLYAGGSRKLAMEIVSLGKRPDVYASADYKLIETMLMPNFTSWYIIFATNEIVLAYTRNSRYAGEINSSNWWRILNRSDVRWGHSDPDLDPCGYRALIVIKLAERYYGVRGLFDSLMSSENRIIRPKSVDLLSLLESGELDYAFEYKSVAIQHNLSFVSLPREINLGDWDMAEYYAQANITLSDGSVVFGEPIAYGITILNEAPNKDLAIRFVKLILERPGVLERCGQNAITPAIASNIDALPEELRGYVRG